MRDKIIEIIARGICCGGPCQSEHDCDYRTYETAARDASAALEAAGYRIEHQLHTDDDEPKTFRELAEAAISDFRRYANDEMPERRLVSCASYEERLAMLAAAGGIDE